jgi:hypothetical protein
MICLFSEKKSISSKFNNFFFIFRLAKSSKKRGMKFTIVCCLVVTLFAVHATCNPTEQLDDRVAQEAALKQANLAVVGEETSSAKKPVGAQRMLWGNCGWNCGGWNNWNNWGGWNNWNSQWGVWNRWSNWGWGK